MVLEYPRGSLSPLATSLINGYLSTAFFTLLNNATNLSTNSTLMERDVFGQTHLKGLQLDGSVSGTINIYPAATTTTYTVTLPPAQGTGLLSNNGSGTLSWFNNTPTTPQTISATTNSAGSSSNLALADHVHAHGLQAGIIGTDLHALATSTYDGFMSSAQFTLLANATSADNTSTLVLRDGTGSAAFKNITVSNSLSNTVTLSAPTASFTNYTWIFPTAPVAASPIQFLTTTIDGITSWTSPPLATGSVPGYLSTTFYSLLNDSTNLSTPLTLMERDGSGSVNVQSLQLDFGPSTNALTIAPGSGMASNITFTMPNNTGVSGYILQTDGTGVLTWVPGPGGPTNFATPVAVGTVNAQGIATTTVRSDHVHAHGNQPGGSVGSTMHAVADAIYNGFMSSAQFTQLTNATSLPNISTLVERDGSGYSWISRRSVL